MLSRTGRYHCKLRHSPVLSNHPPSWSYSAEMYVSSMDSFSILGKVKIRELLDAIINSTVKFYVMLYRLLRGKTALN